MRLPLVQIYREPADSSGLTALVGEYRVRCFFSRTWALRDAAINKIRMLIQSEYKNEPGVAALLSPLVVVMKTGLEDKIAQVFFSSAGLLDEYLALTKTYVHSVLPSVLIIDFPFHIVGFGCLGQP